jgi:putative ABC transport system ATP-binding protein
MATLIKIDNLHKIYKTGEVEVRALRGVTLNINPGEFVAIMGPSGSGKSTLMNILGCLDKPSQGSYYLDEIDIAGLNKNRLAEIRGNKIGFVFQNFNLLSRTTALENVELPMLYTNVSRSERHRRAKESLSAVGLSGREKHFSSQLSGGEQQRVAIARALVNQPPLILADEPTGNLDTRTSLEIMGIFQDFNYKGKTIILITHEPDIARYADRNITFRDGKIREDKPVSSRLNAREMLNQLPNQIED